MAGLTSGLTRGLAGTLTGRALRRGLVGGHPAWRLVLVGVGVARLLRVLGAGRPAVLREELRPGESLVVRHLARPNGSDRGDGSTGEAS